MAFVSYNNTYVIALRRTLRIPIERVRRAIESEEERALWLNPPLRFEFDVGGRIYTSEGMPIAEFTDYQPGKRWELRWISPLNTKGSKVIVEIIRVGRTTTRVVVRHWHIKNAKDYHELAAGWTWFLDSLEKYFTTEKYLEYDYPDVFGNV